MPARGPSPPSAPPRSLATAVNASTSWAYWTHYIRDPQRAGMLSWIGNQGVLGALERMLGHTVTTPTTFVIVVTVACVGLAVAAAAYRRSSPVLGLLVVEATESLASPVSWSHHFIWVILLVAWLALAEDRPRYGEWYALAVAVLFWAAPTWWVPHGPDVTFAGQGLAHPAVGRLRVALHRAGGRRGRSGCGARRRSGRSSGGGRWRPRAPAADASARRPLRLARRGCSMCEPRSSLLSAGGLRVRRRASR